MKSTKLRALEDIGFECAKYPPESLLLEKGERVLAEYFSTESYRYPDARLFLAPMDRCVHGCFVHTSEIETVLEYFEVIDENKERESND